MTAYVMNIHHSTRTGSRRARIFIIRNGAIQDITLPVANKARLRYDEKREAVVVLGHGFALGDHLLSSVQKYDPEVTEYRNL